MRIILATVWLVAFNMTASGREVKLEIWSVEVTEPAKTLRLLPVVDAEGDAVPLYEQAIKALPKSGDMNQIREWLKLQAAQLPQKEAEQVLQKYTESLRLVVKATRCKECNWPEWKPGTQPMNLDKFRTLAFVIELWARLEISRAGYDGAVAAMQTGFGMARHLGHAPIIVQALIGAAVSGIMCKEVEQFVQQETAPNLYHALENLPEPIIDMEKAIENEKKVGLEQVTNDALRKQFEQQKEPMYQRVRMTCKKLDNNLNILQCVETIRHYIVIHDRELPEKLSDITELEVPKDLVNDKAFEYRRTDTGAVLQSALPTDGDEKDILKYEIELKK